MIFALLKPFILPNQMTAEYLKNPAQTSDRIIVQKAAVESLKKTHFVKPLSPLLPLISEASKTMKMSYKMK